MITIIVVIEISNPFDEKRRGRDSCLLSLLVRGGSDRRGRGFLWLLLFCQL